MNSSNGNGKWQPQQPQPQQPQQPQIWQQPQHSPPVSAPPQQWPTPQAQEIPTMPGFMPYPQQQAPSPAPQQAPAPSPQQAPAPAPQPAPQPQQPRFPEPPTIDKDTVFSAPPPRKTEHAEQQINPPPQPAALRDPSYEPPEKELQKWIKDDLASWYQWVDPDEYRAAGFAQLKKDEQMEYVVAKLNQFGGMSPQDVVSHLKQVFRSTSQQAPQLQQAPQPPTTSRKGSISQGMILYIDCCPENSETFQFFSDWVQPLVDAVSNNNGAYYLTMDYNKGCAALAASIDLQLKKDGYSGQMVILSSHPAYKYVIEPLLLQARTTGHVIRSMKR